MKKVLICAGLVFAVAAASSSLALFREAETAQESPSAALVSPPTPVQAAEVTDGGGKTPGRCGSKAGNCGAGQSGRSCCGSSPTGATASVSAEEVKNYLQQYYREAMGEDVTVEVNDLGCHQEAEIRKEDRVIKRLSISGGRITDIT